MNTEVIRTALFVPGDRPERVDKALKCRADAVIIDLEDAVAVSKKSEARDNTKQKIQKYGDECFIIVRVNSKVSGLLEKDLNYVVTQGLSAVMLPKVENKADIELIDKLLCDQEKNNNIDEGKTALFPLIESAKGIQNISDILSPCNGSDRIFTVAFGAADYTLDMAIEITSDGTELIFPRSKIAVACVSAGIKPPLDTPFMIDIKNVNMLKDDARKAKQLGFGGKLCIHPVQILPCNEIFSPRKEEIEYAKKVVQAFQNAENQGTAAVQLDGKFIDYPVFKKSLTIVNIAKKLKL
jgi:citrate lyase subunit beta/citryl-CoA lyase